MLNDSQDFYNIKHVSCEGYLGYLNDSFIRPFDYPHEERFAGSLESSNVVEYFLNWILTCHNEQVNESQKILLGNVTIRDSNNYMAYSSIEFLSSFEVIKTRLLDTHGGYLRLRHEETGAYLDYIVDYTADGTEVGAKLACTQTIEFGENLLDLTREAKGESIKTGIIPLGARITNENGEQTDEYLTIEELEDKTISEGIIKSGDYILNTTLAAQYGKIFEVVKWEDVQIASNLLTKAVNYLADSVKYKMTIELKALDLKLTNDQIGTFKVGQYIRCISSPHSLNELYLLKKLTLDIGNPQNTTITIGEDFLSLADIQSESLIKTDDLIKRVETVEKTRVSKEEIDTIIDQQIERSNIIDQTTEKIMTDISEKYTTLTEFTKHQETVSTQFTQTNTQFELKFTTIEELINRVNANSSANYNEITKYIRFINGEILLGETGSELVLKIGNTKVSFLQNGIEVAYISNRKLYITDGEFLNSLNLGNFGFFPRSSGNLTFRKVEKTNSNIVGTAIADLAIL